MVTRLPAAALVPLSRSLLPSARPPTIATLAHLISSLTLRPNASISVHVAMPFAPATQLVEPRCHSRPRQASVDSVWSAAVNGRA